MNRCFVFLSAFLMFSSLNAQGSMYYPTVFFGKSKGFPICLINIPKNCSTYLRHHLFNEHKPKYMTFDPLRPKMNHFLKVMCIRDPMYRSIACYNEVMKLRKGCGVQKKTMSMDFWKCRDDVCLSFTTFLREIDGNFFEPHISHQYRCLRDKGLMLRHIDFIFLQEEMEHDIQLFDKKYGRDVTTVEMNVTPDRIKKILVEHIDNHPGIQAQIRKLWAEDFEFYEAAKKRRLEILQGF